MEPFGIFNSEPNFVVTNSEILDILILKEKHIKFKLHSDGNIYDAIFFNSDKSFIKSFVKNGIKKGRGDFLFFPFINSFQGIKKVELKLKDFKIF